MWIVKCLVYDYGDTWTSLIFVFDTEEEANIEAEIQERCPLWNQVVIEYEDENIHQY